MWRRFNVKPRDLEDPQLLDTRFIEDVPLGLIFTEKEIGRISFKTVEDEIDYTGFKSRDENTLKWAHDAFNFYWEKASDVWPQELIGQGYEGLSLDTPYPYFLASLAPSNLPSLNPCFV